MAIDFNGAHWYYSTDGYQPEFNSGLERMPYDAVTGVAVRRPFLTQLTVTYKVVVPSLINALPEVLAQETDAEMQVWAWFASQDDFPAAYSGEIEGVPVTPFRDGLYADSHSVQWVANGVWDVILTYRQGVTDDYWKWSFSSNTEGINIANSPNDNEFVAGTDIQPGKLIGVTKSGIDGVDVPTAVGQLQLSHVLSGRVLQVSADRMPDVPYLLPSEYDDETSYSNLGYDYDTLKNDPVAALRVLCSQLAVSVNNASWRGYPKWCVKATGGQNVEQREDGNIAVTLSFDTREPEFISGLKYWASGSWQTAQEFTKMGFEYLWSFDLEQDMTTPAGNVSISRAITWYKVLPFKEADFSKFFDYYNELVLSANQYEGD